MPSCRCRSSSGFRRLLVTCVVVCCYFVCLVCVATAQEQNEVAHDHSHHDHHDYDDDPLSGGCRRPPPPHTPRPNTTHRHFAPLAATCTTPDGHRCEQCCGAGGVTCCEDVSLGSALPASTEVWVPIRFILLTPNGNPERRELTSAQMNGQLNVLNSAFYANGGSQTSKFRFHFHSYQAFEDNRMHDSCVTDPCYVNPSTCDFYVYTLPRVLANPEGVVNVVVCDLRTYSGEAQWPWASAEHSPLQYVQIHYTAMWGHGVPGTTRDGGKTLVHEVGHYFGLLHIFEIMSKCDQMGDYVVDTPASYGAASPYDACSVVLDTCPGQPGQDDHGNYMNYARDSCMSHFSPGQIARMEAATTLYRPIFLVHRLVSGTCTDASNLSTCTCTNGAQPLEFCGNPVMRPKAFGPLDADEDKTTLIIIVVVCSVGVVILVVVVAVCIVRSRGKKSSVSDPSPSAARPSHSPCSGNLRDQQSSGAGTSSGTNGSNNTSRESTAGAASSKSVAEKEKASPHYADASADVDHFDGVMS